MYYVTFLVAHGISISLQRAKSRTRALGRVVFLQGSQSSLATKSKTIIVFKPINVRITWLIEQN